VRVGHEALPLTSEAFPLCEPARLNCWSWFKYLGIVDFCLREFPVLHHVSEPTSAIDTDDEPHRHNFATSDQTSDQILS
jgi:hypothetical protein